MEFPFFIVLLIALFALIALRAIMRDRHRKSWKTVFETNARGDGIALQMRQKLNESHVRSRLVFKGPPNNPYMGMSGEQHVSIEVHIADLHIARPIVTKVLNQDWQGRF